MGTIPADKVVERASVILYDRTQKAWPVDELLQWLNDGQLAVVQLRPDVYTATRSVLLAPGTRQTIPAADLRLLDVPRNMGQDGQTAGVPIRYVDRKQMDVDEPAWHTSAASATVRHWMYDQATPKTWWCWPPQPPANRGYVELDVSAVPPNMKINGVGGALSTTPLQIDDIWLNPLLVFTVYRAFSKDSEHTQRGGKAGLAWNEFLQVMGVRTTVHQRFDPSKNQAPRYDSPPKSDSQGAFGTP